MKDPYGDFLRSNPGAYISFVVVMPLTFSFMFIFLPIVVAIESGLSFGLILAAMFGLLCGFIAIRGLVNVIRYFRDPEEKEKRKSEARRRAAIANLPSRYDPFASSASASSSQPVTVTAASNQPNILQRYRAARAYLDSCGTYDEEKFREMNRITGNMFSEEDIRKQLAESEMMIDGMEALKKIHCDSLTEAIAVFEQVEAKGIDLSKLNV